MNMQLSSFTDRKGGLCHPVIHMPVSGPILSLHESWGGGGGSCHTLIVKFMFLVYKGSSHMFAKY